MKFPVCDMDYYVEKKLPSQATIEYAYPVASSCFYKFVPEETLKRCFSRMFDCRSAIA